MANKPFNEANIIRCYTTQHMAAIYSKDPAVKARAEEYEGQLQEFIRGNDPSPDVPPDTDPIIPVNP